MNNKHDWSANSCDPWIDEEIIDVFIVNVSFIIVDIFYGDYHDNIQD